MSEESTTTDLAELTRRQLEAVNRRDMDAVMSRFPPDGVYDTSPDGLVVYEGPAAIRAFIGEWWDAFEELALEPEDVLDLGHGIVFSLVRQTARPANSTGRVQRREAYVLEWVEDMIRQVTVYTDIDEGRAAAERLVEERAKAMSENLDLVRSLYRDHFERGEFFGRAEWAHPEIECVIVDGPAPDSGIGLAGMARVWKGFLAAYDDFLATVEEYREIDAQRILVLLRFSGRGKASGLEIGSMSTRNASVYDIDGGLVRRLALYWDRERAFADLGLAE